MADASLPTGGSVNREKAALRAMERADYKLAAMYPTDKRGTPEANSAWAHIYRSEYSALVSKEPWKLTTETK